MVFLKNKKINRIISALLVCLMVINVDTTLTFAENTNDTVSVSDNVNDTDDVSINDSDEETEDVSVSDNAEETEAVSVSDNTEKAEDISASDNAENTDSTQAYDSDDDDLTYVCELETVSNIDLPDSDELFGKYVEKEIQEVISEAENDKSKAEINETISSYDGIFSTESVPAAKKIILENKLSTNEIKVAEYLKTEIEKIARGERTNTSIEIPFTALGLKDTYTYEELGITGKDGVSTKLWDIDMKNVQSTLLYDLSYDLYWFDKTVGYSYGMPYSYNSTTILDLKLVYEYNVSADYSKISDTKGTLETDATKTGATVAALNEAERVVEVNKAKNDLEKLIAYKEYICDNNTYNDEAADDNNHIAYGNPWQLIYVFDGDDTTNVVCEGYSKAMTLLCDLSTFKSKNIRCITVSGVMAGGTGQGGHMWNNILMDDGKTYLVDITNSDSGSIGQDGGLFLNGYAHHMMNNDCDQYRFDFGTSTHIYFIYDSAMYNIYSPEELTISDTDYVGSMIEEDETFDYELDDDGNAIITGYKLEDPEVVFPEIIKGFTVVGIAEDAFRGNVTITSVQVSDSITYIGKNAFYNCLNLESVDLGEGIEEIGASAFYGSAITEITIPESVKLLNSDAFGNCTELRRVVINSDQIEGAMGRSPFSLDNLTEIVFSEDMTSIPESLFNNLNAKDGLEVVIPASIESIGRSAFASNLSGLYNGSVRKITFEEGSALKVIEPFAFHCTELTKVSIPESVEEIGDNAFGDLIYLETVEIEGCNIKDNKDASPFSGSRIEELILPNDMVRIPSGLFNTANFVEDFELIVPENIEEIGSKAFGSNAAGITRGISKLTFAGNKVRVIESMAFYCACIEDLVIPESVEVIENNAFSYNFNLNTVTLNTSKLPDNKQVSPFSGSKVNAIYFGENVKRVPAGLFAGLECYEDAELVIPATIEEIGDNAFYQNHFYTITFEGNNLKSIGSMAFYNSNNFSEIVIPESVEAVGNSAFSFCSNLKRVVIDSGKIQGDRYVTPFSDTVLDEVVLSENVTSIPESFFSGVKYSSENIVEIAIPASTTEIGKRAFYNSSWKGVEKVTFLGNNLTTIRECAFYGSQFEEVVIPYGVTTIEKGAFENCTNLKRVVIPETVINFPAKGSYYYIFNGCHKDIEFCVVSGSKAEEYLIENGVLESSIKHIYSVSYELDGGIGNEDNSLTYDDLSEYIIVKAPEKAGFTFVGWYYDSKFTDCAILAEDLLESGELSVSDLSGSIILYAKWKENEHMCEYKGMTASIDGSLNMNFYLTFDELAIDKFDSSAVMFVDKDSNSRSTLKVLRIDEMEEVEDDNGDVYYVATVPIEPSKMGDTITGELYIGDTKYSTIFEQTMAGYLSDIISGDYPAKSKLIAKALLYYGGTVQTYMSYKTDNLVSSEIIEAGYTIASLVDLYKLISDSATYDYSGNTDNVRFVGASLDLNNNISMYLYYDIDGDDSNKSCSIYMINEDGTDGERFDNVPLLPGDDYYMVGIIDIPVSDITSSYRVEITDGDEINIVTYSPSRYIAKSITSNDTLLRKVSAAIINLYSVLISE